MIKRRASRVVRVGDVEIGGAGPIVVQSMTKTDTRDVAATVNQIQQLADCGCEIVRCATPDMEAAQSLGEIKKRASIPVIADIHFDYRLALEALKGGVDGLRLNPGNISDPDKVTAVVQAAKERSVPIRIGVNNGSLPRNPKPGATVVEQMVAAALEQIELLESLDFDLIKVSLKSFDVPTTIEAYQTIAARMPYPLHVGITEAGLPWAGAIRSAVGIGILLYQGLGDTIRVSLTTPDSTQEVTAAYEILKSLDLRAKGSVLVSCPTCGRTEADVVELARKVEQRLRQLQKPVKVAVMGCVVNGPGEAKDADVGIACGKGKGVIFRKGEKVRTVDEAEAFEALMREVEAL